ncbi:MAG TPA: hypothetical protein VEK39_07285 [Solirubrobacterales bacterium]|nr:hypothetical protein [Solirubrobacterales bacterium]
MAIAVAVSLVLGAGAGSAHALTLADLGSVAGDPAFPELPALDAVNEGDLLAALQGVSGHPHKLKAPPPDWYGPAEQDSLAGGGSGTVAAAPADAPLPGQVGIRPGSMMIEPFICTMNYIFSKGDTLAIGTAGHCLEAGEKVVLLTLAPTGGDPVLVELGKILLKRDGGIGHDYGLVKIPASRYDWVSPTIADVGGPCGEYTGGDPQPVAHYGHGLVGGDGGTPRAGMGIESDAVRGFELQWDNDSYSWVGELSNGDSGSPVRIAQLPAVGNLTHGIGLNVPVPQPSALGWGTRITTITSGGWNLVNSPLCP